MKYFGRASTERLYDAIVVGGGCAGLTAAREIGAQGRSVLVIEARDRLGGRAWFKHNALNGYSLEMGGAWFDPNERYAWSEIDRYGLATRRGEVPDWPGAWLIAGQLRHTPLPVHWRELPHVEQLVVELNQAARRIDFERPISEQGLADLDVSLDAFLSGRGMEEATRDIVEVFFRAYGSAPASSISTLHLARRVAAAGGVVGFVTSGSGYRLEGGTAALVEAISNDTAADFALSAPVSAIRQREGDIAVETREAHYRARTVVVAVPMNVQKTIEFDPPLGAFKLALSEEELACVGVKVWALVRNAPTGFFACGRGAGLDWLSSEGGNTEDGVLMVGYGPDAEKLDVNDRKAVERAVRSFLAEAEVIDICGHDWRHDPYARETWAVFRPGQITRGEPHLRSSEGGISFAGSHTATRWTGFIDGAIESGFRAAAEVNARLAASGAAPAGQT